MIQIKNRPDNLNTFQTQRVIDLKNALRLKVADGIKPNNSDIDDKIWKTDEVRDALFNSQKKKCCYCERKRAKKREFDGEHFRPKLEITEDRNHWGYWWLAYEWSNIFYACKVCNQQYKKNHFPVNGIRAREESDSLNVEEAVLINPESENPEQFIGFDWQKSYYKYVLAVGLDHENRGYQNIVIFGLNDLDLMEERAEHLTMLEDVAHATIHFQRTNNQTMLVKQNDKIRKLTYPCKKFSGFHRAYFRGMGLGDFVFND